MFTLSHSPRHSDVVPQCLLPLVQQAGPGPGFLRDGEDPLQSKHTGHIDYRIVLHMGYRIVLHIDYRTVVHMGYCIVDRIVLVCALYHLRLYF